MITYSPLDPIVQGLQADIILEANLAAHKHPVWSKDPVKRAAIISEEAGEVIREALHIDEGHGDIKLLEKELIQTAATCMRMLYLMATEKTENNGS